MKKQIRSRRQEKKRQLRALGKAGRGLRLEDERQSAYGRRNRTLRELGFHTYHDYLESDLWKRIRDKVLGQQKTCDGCGKPANQVHHFEYSRAILLGEDLTKVTPICQRCHHEIEFDQNGNKLSPRRTIDKWRNMVHQRMLRPWGI